MTYGKRQFEAVEETVRKLLPTVHDAMVAAVPMIDADTDAFNDYMAAMKLTEGREAAMEAGLRKAIAVPLGLAQHVDSVWPALMELAAVGNINCQSDLQVSFFSFLFWHFVTKILCYRFCFFKSTQVGARCLKTAVQGARDNVVINLAGLKDEAYKAQVKQQVDQLVKTAKTQCRRVLDILDQRTA